MDSYLIDYLKSGKAWVLVGSGPSVAMGYPSWEKLASLAVKTLKIDRHGTSFRIIDSALEHKDYPTVFEHIKDVLGGPRLLQILHEKFAPSSSGKIYKLLARWPVPVYLTTNYDDEIQKHLTELGETYIPYSNSEDHFSSLRSDLKGAIFKLHGDLRSETGLILTKSQYRDISESKDWEYWRTKMTSVFQMNPMIIIGHSLTDKNIQHILEAAKRGAGVLQPICWIAPDVKDTQKREYLEKYRIRVIPYDNRDGEHKNLLRLIDSINDFIPPRTSIHISSQIQKITESPLGHNAGAPGLFVFNKLMKQGNFEEKRIAVIIAAIQSVLPVLSSQNHFSLKTALEYAGWPQNIPLSPEIEETVSKSVVEQGILEPINGQFKVGKLAENTAIENKRHFEHLRERFNQSLIIRLKRGYPTLKDTDIQQISNDIDLSLSGYFREGGLSLATTLISSTQKPEYKTAPVPSSIIKFITEASAKYDDLLKRQAFCTVSVEAFSRAESAERDYLGRMSKGYFDFHLLGVCGDEAIERLKHTKEIVWLIDSSAQIPALAIASSTNHMFVNCFLRLKDAGVRLFTTERLCEETYYHFDFAHNMVKHSAPNSPLVIAASTGQAPYRKSNQFLEGFVRWQAAGNQCDWESYLFRIFGTTSPKEEDVKKALSNFGIEVIPFQDWPGFSNSDLSDREDYTKKIMQIAEELYQRIDYKGEIIETDFERKAKPEAEALIVVLRERKGVYYILSEKGLPSRSYFVSGTSILNAIEKGEKITWQPDSFLRFASTLSPTIDSEAADEAFETLLWNLAQSGISLLDEKEISTVFGAIIDQASLNILEQREMYAKTIEEKYGEPLASVMQRVKPMYRPLAAIQIANEMAQVQEERFKKEELRADEESKRADTAEKKLKEVEHFRKKLEAKKARPKKKHHTRKNRKK